MPATTSAMPRPPTFRPWNSRRADPVAGPGDERMARYLDQQHHPGHALLPRVAYVAEHEDNVVGYLAGHLTTRFGCEGEVQYLYVSPEYRRQKIASQLMRKLASWFLSSGARRICVNVGDGDDAARAFYAQHGAEQLRPHWMVWEDVSRAPSSASGRSD